jgi:hypothetical protein
MWSLETLGRTRLSQHFFMRDFLHSEIGNFYGLPNIPDDPDLAIAAGGMLCTELLEPLHATFGGIAVRSGFRSVALNDFGNANKLNCARNEADFAGHIWDRRDAAGRMGAMATIVIPWFADQYDQGRDWRDMAYWLYDHLKFDWAQFFPKLCALNLGWREEPRRKITSYIAPRGTLVAAHAAPAADKGARQERYADFPKPRLCSKNTLG